ncbi:IS4 family transposase, partial [Clostridium tarantellae]
MKNHSNFVKKKLKNIVNEMTGSIENFVRNPSKDFVRNRKLTFENMMILLLSMGGGSIRKELLDFSEYSIKTPTPSAFVQQRNKILPSAFEYLFKEFTSLSNNYKLFRGYRVLAADGSVVNIAHNKDDKSTYTKNSRGKGFNSLHLNALFDLTNKLYVDACIQRRCQKNEHLALTDMIDNSSLAGKVIIIADRGYESYNTLAHIQEKNWNYLFRIKDITSKGMASSFDLPLSGAFDKVIKIKITRRQTKEIKENPKKYKFLPKNSKFDYLELKSPKFYDMSFRVVRFKISDNSYETIITNLDSNQFSPSDLKTLYHMRWGIETAFRELKYAIGMVNFHSKKVDFIKQEIFAKLTMYNFCEMITMNVVISQKQRKHEYQVNFTTAIHICRYFFKCSNKRNLPSVELLIQQNILPVRKGRQDRRKLRAQSP